VIECRPLHYSAGADPRQDRPGHVRAGSGLAAMGSRLAVIQDDANFVALLDITGEEVGYLALPAGEGDRRQFDDERGNKRWKLDLEACTWVPELGLVAFGSGATPLRERIVVISGWEGQELLASVFEAAAFYAALRANEAFAGSELNLEGAVYQTKDRMLLFQRGNGAVRGGRRPVDATAEVDWAALWAWLRDPEQSLDFGVGPVTQYELGALDGVRLTFTDATAAPEGILFAAAAEASPDAVLDGPVAGSVLGVLARDGRARWVRLVTPAGRPFSGKVEGVALSPTDPHLALVVVDGDDPATPSHLCRVALEGPWFGGSEGAPEQWL
jgi:hypothetical protein